MLGRGYIVLDRTSASVPRLQYRSQKIDANGRTRQIIYVIRACAFFSLLWWESKRPPPIGKPRPENWNASNRTPPIPH